MHAHLVQVSIWVILFFFFFSNTCNVLSFFKMFVSARTLHRETQRRTNADEDRNWRQK